MTGTFATSAILALLLGFMPRTHAISGGPISCGQSVAGDQTRQDSHSFADLTTFEFVADVPYASVFVDACTSTYDTVLYLFDSDQNLVTMCDDCFAHRGAHCTGHSNAGDLDVPLNADGVVPAGTRYIGVGGYSNAGGSYELALQCEAVDPVEEIREIACGERVTGVHAASTAEDEVETLFVVNLGSAYASVYLEACESNFDTWLYVYDSERVQLDQCDDCNSHGEAQTQCAHLNAGDLDIPVSTTTNAVDAGTYYFGLRGYRGAGGPYDVTLHCTAESGGGSTCNRDRRSWSDLTAAERDLYASGFRALAADGTLQSYSDAHNTLSNEIHNVDAFLPWHRAFITGFEDAIRALGPAYDCFALPYWDWSNEPRPSEVSVATPLLIVNSGLGTAAQSLACVPNLYTSAGRAQGGSGACAANELPRAFAYAPGNDWCEWTQPSALMDMIDRTPPAYSTFRSEVEWLPHSEPHVCVGGNMATMYSPDDPIFWMHHCFVDYLWALWQDCNAYEDASGAAQYGSGATAALAFGENTQIPSVTIASTLDLEAFSPPIRYEKGPFWANANVDGTGNCNDGTNAQWFYAQGGRRRRRLQEAQTESQRTAQEIYDALKASHPELSEAELVHLWNVAVCEHKEQTAAGSVCAYPSLVEGEWDRCADMAIDGQTKDIVITKEELLSKRGITPCMRDAVEHFYDWASITHTLAGLCGGCYAPFCDRTFIAESCVRLNSKDAGMPLSVGVHPLKAEKQKKEKKNAEKTDENEKKEKETKSVLEWEEHNRVRQPRDARYTQEHAEQRVERPRPPPPVQEQPRPQEQPQSEPQPQPQPLPQPHDAAPGSFDAWTVSLAVGFVAGAVFVAALFCAYQNCKVCRSSGSSKAVGGGGGEAHAYGVVSNSQAADIDMDV